jgi:hypothetical protein
MSASKEWLRAIKESGHD